MQTIINPNEQKALTVLFTGLFFISVYIIGELFFKL